MDSIKTDRFMFHLYIGYDYFKTLSFPRHTGRHVTIAIADRLTPGVPEDSNAWDVVQMKKLDFEIRDQIGHREYNAYLVL